MDRFSESVVTHSVWQRCLTILRWTAVVTGLVLISLFIALRGTVAWSQEGPAPQKQPNFAEMAAADATPEPKAAPTAAAPAKPQVEEELNWATLMTRGGPLMVPIGFFSLIVLVFGFERLLAIRRNKVLPAELVHGLGQVFNVNEQLTEDDLKTAYKLCNTYPSPAAKIIKVALLKASRPHSEVEQAVKEASEREADRLYGNVRPLNLSTTVAPLLGLLGTIQGMIEAFHMTATGDAQVNKAEALAHGIYVALVTTFAGLCVAIPAAILAHWFEGKIQRLFREVEEMLLGVMPALEQFENKVEIRRAASGSAAPPPPGTPMIPTGSKKPMPAKAGDAARRNSASDREEQRGI